MDLDIDPPRAALLAFALVVLLGVGTAAGTSGASFGLYNFGWNGASELRTLSEEADAQPTVVRSTTEYDRLRANGTVAIVLSPDEPYETNESARLRTFVERGGTLVVAEDFGPHGNDLLASLNASTRVDGRTLRDEQHHYRSPALPVATNVSNESAVGTENLTLNYGTVLRPNGATVLVSSSGYGYLDANGNERPDEGEPMESHPVATSERIGDGRVIVVSDASALINAMLDRPGNRAFVAALLAEHDRVALDFSHAERFPPLAVAVLALRESAALQVALGTLLVGLVGAWARWPTLRGRGVVADLAAELGLARSRPDPASIRLDRGEVVAYLADAHPEWDERRVERVADAVVERRDG
ncbi:DUF4350 domain-containing protein [Halomarina halobia]|uniref:DUF4350 domain-containing protein n=1 Tax=Halomarina halobia TaxID=3033386 RepID=A0ABD6A7E3_9EURY|nr:DUF4350 domain-containing protein [Halomarina sp. PSR21]